MHGSKRKLLHLWKWRHKDISTKNRTELNPSFSWIMSSHFWINTMTSESMIKKYCHCLPLSQKSVMQCCMHAHIFFSSHYVIGTTTSESRKCLQHRTVPRNRRYVQCSMAYGMHGSKRKLLRNCYTYENDGIRTSARRTERNWTLHSLGYYRGAGESSADKYLLTYGLCTGVGRQ